MERFSDTAGIFFDKAGIHNGESRKKLIEYVRLIHSENLKYNLTGHKSLEDIIDNLIIKSISSVNFSDVPRGTSVADMGTGAGVPGVPLAIMYPELCFTLFDSTEKKINFIRMVIDQLGINNIDVVCLRLEDCAKDKKYREVFDLVVSRAMSEIYMAAELCSQFVKVNGFLYLYVNERQKEIGEGVKKHLNSLNLSITENSGMFNLKITEGLLMKKTGKTPDTYPRRITAIKRGMLDIEKGAV